MPFGKNNNSLYDPRKNNSYICAKGHFILASKKKASITVEASITVTISVLVLGCFLILFPFLKRQVAIYQFMYEVSESAKIESAITEKAAPIVLMAECNARWKAKNKSDVVFVAYENDNRIYLNAIFEMNLPLKSIFDGRILSVQTITIGNWTGYAGEKEEEYVYVTKSGSVYHTRIDCPHLHVSVRKVMFVLLEGYRNDSGAKYYPCEYCTKGSESSEYVFITPDGNRYHNDEDCQALLRDVRRCKLSEVEGVLPCCKDCEKYKDE